MDPKPHNSDKVKSRQYSTRTGCADMQHELYEVKLAALLFARGLKKSEDFHLACNMNDAGHFDDVVFKLRHQTLLIQLKCQINTTKKIKLEQLIKKEGKFSLVRYFKSYCEMKQKWAHTEDMQYCGRFSDFFFIIYTNAVMSEGIGNDVDNTDWHNVLSSGGRCISFTEDISLMKHLTDSPDFQEFHIDLSDFKEFLSRLQFFTRQAAQEDLDDLIRQEIECLYGTSAVYKQFLDGVQDWWQNKNFYLTNEVPFWKNIFQVCVDNISEKKHKEAEALCIRFKEDVLDLILTQLKPYQMLYVIPEGAGDSVILSCLKVHQSLSNECHLLVDGRTLQSHWNEVVAIWTRFCDFLVVVEAGSVDMNILVNLLQKHPSKRLVFVAATVTWDKLEPKFATFHDHIAVRQLDEVSQVRVLGSLVCFQGHDISLGEVTGSNVDLVPADVIVKLLTYKLELGDALTGDLEYYIPRTLQHTFLVRDQILLHRETDSSVTFAVSGLSDPQLQQLMSPGKEIYMSEKHTSEKNKCKIEAISTEDEFLKLTKSCETVHWLHKEGNMFIWRQSWGDMSIVLKYLKQFENVDSVMDVPDRVTLVSAESGMGKSTLLTHLALGTKETHPAMWVVRVNLSDFTPQLDKLTMDLQLHDVIEFLLEASGVTAEWKPLFKWKLATMENVCVLFDGYDEISPIYGDRVALMLKFLQATKLQKLWVTTRLVMKEKLQHELSTWALTLQPFLKSNQRNFLAKFWKRSMPHIEDHKLNAFITKLLQLTARNFNDRDRHFTGIPLQSMLLAEEFENNLRTYSEQDILELPEKFDLFQLYNRFVDRKLEIFYSKHKVDITKPGLNPIYNQQKQMLKENHMISALFLLLPPSDIEKFPHSADMTDRFKSFIDRVQEGSEQTGIIKQIIEIEPVQEVSEQTGIIKRILKRKPVFIHKTFVEYFSALWFAKNFKNVQSYMNIKLFDPNFHVVWNFFNRMLAQKFPLHIAVLNQDKVSVETLLSKQILDINTQDEGGRTALHLAVMSLIDIQPDDPSHSIVQQIIATLLRHGADPSIKDKVSCWRPLRTAERIREWLVVEMLLRKQADREDLFLTAQKINNKNEKYIQDVLIVAARYGLVQLIAFMFKRDIRVGHAINVVYEGSHCKATMLHEAARHAQVALVQFLLIHNANTAAYDSLYGRSALMWAAKEGNFEVVDVLTKESTDVNMCDLRGDTALLIAAKNKRWDIAKLLSQRHADVKTCDWTGSNVLHISAESGHTEFVACLLDMGQIEIDCQNKYQQTPLWLAAQSGHLQVSQLLLKQNANLHVWDKEGCTPLHTAASGGHAHIVQLLLKHGVSPSARDKRENTPLHAAAAGGHVHIVQLLLQHGASPSAHDERECTPLHAAAAGGHVHIVQLLLQHGASPSARDKRECTPLHAAAAGGHVHIVQLLLQHGASPSAHDERECTPQHAAAAGGHGHIVQLLLQHGASPSARDKGECTPLHAAAAGGHVHIVQLLLQHGASPSALDMRGCTPLDVATATEVTDRLQKKVTYLLQKEVTDLLPSMTL